MATHTFDIAHAVKAITLNPNGTLVLTKQNNSKKTYQCVYLDMTFKVGNLVSKQCWFRIKDVTLTAGIMDAERAKTKFTKGDPNKQRLRLTTTVSNSGDLGKFLTLFNPVFIKEINRLVAAKEIIVGKREICEFIQTKVADESSNVEARGQPIEDGIIRLSVDFSAPQEWKRKNFPWGKTITQFMDYDQSYVDDNGKTQYKTAMYKNRDGELEQVGENNIHSYITKGSIIKEAIIFMNSPSISSGYVSSKMMVTNCILQRIQEAGDEVAEPVFDDDDGAITAQSTTATTAVATPTTAASMDDINNLLNNL